MRSECRFQTRLVSPRLRPGPGYHRLTFRQYLGAGRAPRASLSVSTVA